MLFLGLIFYLKNLKTNFLFFVARLQICILNLSKGIIDGILEVDVDTIKYISKSKVKPNPIFLNALRGIIRNDKNYKYNGQLMIRTRFFYKDHPKVKRADFKNTVLKTINNFNEIYSFMVKS